MANLPYITAFSNKIFSALKMYSRVGAFPLDPTSVLNTRDDLVSYITEKGSYAYAGQVVSVANGTTDAANGSKNYSLYVIRSDKSVQKIGANAVFATKADAEAYVANNPVAVESGEVLSVYDEANAKYQLYVVGPKKEDNSRDLIRVSFDQADVPDISWDNLTNKPLSTTTQIDSAVTFTEYFTVNKENINEYNDSGVPVLIDSANRFMVEGDNGSEFKVAYLQDISWGNLMGKPVEFTPSAHTHEHGDIKSINLDATTITGTLNIENLPHGALERCHVVENDEARYALTTANVQNGDTVKVADTGLMYLVVDDSQLPADTDDKKAAAFVEYTAGSATSVAWTGVTGKPTTLAGYGITDAVNTADVVDTASVENAGKVVKVHEDGKLHADITGDAATVGGRAADSFANAVHGHEIDDVEGLDTELANIKNGTSLTSVPASVITGVLAKENIPDSAFCKAITVADIAERNTLTTTQVHKFDTVIVESTGDMYFVVDTGNLGNDAGYQIYTGRATSVDWDKVENKPTTIAGYGITDAVNVSEVVETATANKLLKLNSEAKLPADITGDAATVGGRAADSFADAKHSHADEDIVNVDWSKILNKPTTLEGYGITDAVKSDMIVNTASAANAGKVLTLNDAGKLAVNITGDAATVGGRAADSFADADHTHDDFNQIWDEINHIEDGSAITALDAAVLTGTIDIARLPHGALERCVIVADQAARYKLTANDVQVGDTVKETDTGLMYFVVDSTKLGEAAGYEVYTAGSATSVDWSGITNKPTTVLSSGLTDALSTDDVVTQAGAGVSGKILAVGDDGKLHTDITGDAATVGGRSVDSFANAEHTHEVADIEGLQDTLDSIDEQIKNTDIDASKITSGTIAKERINVENFIAVSAEEPTDLAVGGLWFEIIE